MLLKIIFIKYIFSWLYTEHRKDRLEDKLEKEQKEQFLKKEEEEIVKE